MCTLTYLPLANNSFLLTSNRDEKLHRSLALPPKVYEHNGRLLLYPKDPQGNGSWLAVSPNRSVACLLNGGFALHTPTPPYKMSRGLVLLSVFDYPNIPDFVTQSNFDNIEPFTLIVFADHILHEIRWTGTGVQQQIKDKYQAHIWSSVTLYTPEIIKQRELFYLEYLNTLTRENAADKMMEFHQFKGDDRFPHGIRLERDNGTKTVSISQILMEEEALSFNYYDMLQDKHFMQSMPTVSL
jgi:uncharacterized protein with NRDE domain